MERTLPGPVLRAIGTYIDKRVLEQLDYKMEVVQCNLAKRRSEYTSTPPDESEADVFRAELGAPPAYRHSILWLAKEEALLLGVKSAFLDMMQRNDESTRITL